jgi:aminoglycoside phosphotransferase family enzyme/predicted kinase
VGILQRPAKHEHAALVRGLTRPAAYPEGDGPVTHLETHISHVFLVGDHAYKIKKPLELGFLDFSTLDKRRHYCEEELRINRRLAPELYLAVVPIAGSEDAPRVEGAGPPLEYAVKMRRFPQDGLLEQVLERGELTAARIDEIAAQVARFHAGAERAEPGGRFGSAASVIGPALQNFDQLAPLVGDGVERGTLEILRRWSMRQNDLLAGRFDERQRAGFVRECHGDLHLGNMVLIDGAVRIFDAIEFNAELRWIDVMNEVAFLAMDLAAKGRDDLAWRFVNGYLEHTGDYDGARVLRYYLVYRAIVRGKVAAIRAGQPDTAPHDRRALQEKCRQHLALAMRFAQEEEPALIIHHGLSGSGKTTCSQIVLETIGAIRVRSDLERKRMHGLDAAARTGAPVGGGIYAAQDTADTYDRLARAAEAVLAGGVPVLVDATFLKRAQREAFHRLAARLDVPFRIAHFEASPQALRARVTVRARQGTDASEAGLAVLEQQLTGIEPLTTDERALAVRFDTERLDTEQIRARARELLRPHQHSI